MLKKKLILLFLIGITVTGVTTSNTIRSIAAPLIKSPNILNFPEILDNTRLNSLSSDIIYEISSLEKSIVLRDKINSGLETLAKDQPYILGIKNKFYEISKQLDYLTKKESNLIQQFSKDSMLLSKLNMHTDKNLDNLTGQSNYKNRIITNSYKTRFDSERSKLDYLLTKVRASGKYIPSIETKFQELVKLLKKLSLLIIYSSDNSIPYIIEDTKNENDNLANKEETLASEVNTLVSELEHVLTEAETLMSSTNSRVSPLIDEVFLETLTEENPTRKDDPLTFPKNIAPQSSESNQSGSYTSVTPSVDLPTIDTQTKLSSCTSIINAPETRYDILFSNLHEDIKAEYLKFVTADTLRHKIKIQLLALKQQGVDIFEIQSKFYKISNELNSLRKTETTLMNPFLMDMDRLQSMTNHEAKGLDKYKRIENWMKKVGYQLPTLLESGKDISILKDKFFALSKELEFLMTNVSATNIANHMITKLSDHRSNIFLHTYCNEIDNPHKLKSDSKRYKSKINNLLDETGLLLYSINNTRSNDLSLQSVKSIPTLSQVVQPDSSSNLVRVSKKINTFHNKSEEIEQVIPDNPISQVNIMQSENPVSSVAQIPAPFDPVPALLIAGTRTSVNLPRSIRFSDEIQVFTYEPDETKRVITKTSISKVKVIKSKNTRSSVSPVAKPGSSSKLSNPLNKIKNFSDTTHKKHNMIPKKSISKVNIMKQENPASSVASLEKSVINPIESHINPKKSKFISKIKNINLKSRKNSKNYEVNEGDTFTKINNSNQNSKSINAEPYHSPIEDKVHTKVSSKVISKEKSIEKQLVSPKTESPKTKYDSADNKEKTHQYDNIIISKEVPTLVVDK